MKFAEKRLTIQNIKHQDTLIKIRYKKKEVILTDHPYRSLSRCRPRPCLPEDCRWLGEGTTATPSLDPEGRSVHRSPRPQHNEALRSKSNLYGS